MATNTLRLLLLLPLALAAGRSLLVSEAAPRLRIVDGADATIERFKYQVSIETSPAPSTTTTTTTTTTPSTTTTTTASTTTSTTPSTTTSTTPSTTTASALTSTSRAKPSALSAEDGVVHSFCGGSILAAKWILTAAHCLTDYAGQPELLTVRVGSATWGTGGVAHEVALVAVFPDFTTTDMLFDVGLLQLKEAIAFDAHAGPVTALTASGDAGQAAPGSYITVSGWGLKKFNDPESEKPAALQATRLRVLNNNVCDLAYVPANDLFQEGMICAAAHGKDACTEDSGGPAVDDFGVQVGIVSWGVGCAQYGYPGIYTDLSYPDVHDFITGTMAANP